MDYAELDTRIGQCMREDSAIAQKDRVVLESHNMSSYRDHLIEPVMEMIDPGKWGCFLTWLSLCSSRQGLLQFPVFLFDRPVIRWLNDF